MSKRKRPRLRGKPSWVIALVAGVMTWGIAALVAMLVFELTFAQALLAGAAVCLLVAAPVLFVEAAAASVAIVLEVALGGLVMVMLAPLMLLSMCG